MRMITVWCFLGFLIATSGVAMSPVTEPYTPPGKTGFVQFSYPGGLSVDVARKINMQVAKIVGEARLGTRLDKVTDEKVPPIPLKPFWGDKFPDGSHLAVSFQDSHKGMGKGGGGAVALVDVTSLETSDASLYEQRVLKTVVAQLAMIIGVKSCSKKTCVMYGDLLSAVDADIKRLDFCDACYKPFALAIRQSELWVTPIGGFGKGHNF